jgi:hypothetical protein
LKAPLDHPAYIDVGNGLARQPDGSPLGGPEQGQIARVVSDERAYHMLIV